MGLEAVGKWIKLELSKVPEKSAGGIVIPDAVKNKTVTATVRSIGEYHRQQSQDALGSPILTDLKVGDVVFYKQHAIGNAMKEGDVDVLFIEPQEIFGVIRK